MSGRSDKRACRTAYEGKTLSRHIVIEHEGSHRRDQENDAHRGAKVKPVEIRYLGIDFCGQNIVVSSDHNRITEVSNREVEGQGSSAENSVLCGRNCHFPENLQCICSQAFGCLIQTGVYRRQGSVKNHQGVGKTVENL